MVAEVKVVKIKAVKPQNGNTWGDCLEFGFGFGGEAGNRTPVFLPSLEFGIEPNICTWYDNVTNVHVTR